MHDEEARMRGEEASTHGEGAPAPGDGAPLDGDGPRMLGDRAPATGEGTTMLREGVSMLGEGNPMDGGGLEVNNRFAAAPTFGEFLEGVEAYCGVWYSVSRRSSAPEDLVSMAQALPGHWHLLALAADWCGDALDPIPLIADLADRVEQIELRVVDRDDHPDLMDAHLTDGNRSIPAVIVYDDRFRDLGHWGPRPGPLQEWWVEARAAGVPEGGSIPRGQEMVSGGRGSDDDSGGFSPCFKGRSDRMPRHKDLVPENMHPAERDRGLRRRVGRGGHAPASLRSVHAHGGRAREAQHV